MAGIVFKSPGVFAGAGDMPRISPVRPSPVPGAVADWAASQLPLGMVSVWPSMVGELALSDPGIAISQRPVAIGEGADRYVSFDGANDRLDVAMNVSTPFTLVLVARLPQMGPSQTIISSGNLGIGVDLLTNSEATQWVVGNGTFRALYPVPDTAWHVFVLAFDGSQAYLVIDDSEREPADAGSNGIQWIRLGASSTTYAPSDVKRLTVLPYAADAAERRTIRAVYGDLYGI